MQESVLDKSINAIEINSKEQFQEIMNMHQAVFSQTQKKAVPRFTVHLIEPYQTTTRNQEAARIY